MKKKPLPPRTIIVFSLISLLFLTRCSNKSVDDPNPDDRSSVDFVEELPIRTSFVKNYKNKLLSLSDQQNSGIYDPNTKTLNRFFIGSSDALAIGDNYIVTIGRPNSAGPGRAQARMFDLNDRTFNSTDLSGGRSFPTGVSIGDLMMFAGGLINDASGHSSRIDIFTPVNNWSTAELSEPRAFISAASSSTKVVFAGGEGPYGMSSKVDIYDISSKKWSTANLSEARRDIAATTVGDFICFAGGRTGISAFSKRIDIYNTKTDEWYTAELSQERTGIVAMTVQGKAIFAGGQTWEDINLKGTDWKNIDIFDPYTKIIQRSSLRSITQQGAEGTSIGNRFYITNDNYQIDVYELME